MMQAFSFFLVMALSASSFGKSGGEIATFRLKALESRETVEQIVKHRRLSNKSARGLRLMNQEKVRVVRDLCQLDLAANREAGRSVVSEAFLEGCYLVHLTSWVQFLREGLLADASGSDVGIQTP